MIIFLIEKTEKNGKMYEHLRSSDTQYLARRSNILTILSTAFAKSARLRACKIDRMFSVERPSD